MNEPSWQRMEQGKVGHYFRLNPFNNAYKEALCGEICGRDYAKNDDSARRCKRCARIFGRVQSGLSPEESK